MRTKRFSILIAITCIISIGGVQAAMGAQFDATLDPDTHESEFKISYLRTITIDYSDGGALGVELNKANVNTKFNVDSEDGALDDLIASINTNIVRDGSAVRVSDLMLSYSSELTSRVQRASIDYKITLEGTIEDYRIGARNSEGIQLVDLGWRGLSSLDPVFINGMEINLPISLIKSEIPAVYDMIQGTEVEELLLAPLIDGRAIKQELSSWHFLFDPTGINVDAATYKLDESISGKVVSRYAMGESSFREGIKTEKEKEVHISLDRDYSFKTVESADAGNLNIIGFSTIDSLDDLEVAGVTATKVGGDTSTGDFPSFIVYGMAGMAAVGGVIFFFISHRQIKRESGQGQTGIDPSRLTGYQTSASAGGYQTNRGEAQLKEDDGYSQHQNVYEDGKTRQDAPQSPQQQDATCGCATSADMGSECDCVMQGSCLCDATCNCGSDLCKETAGSMR